MTMGYTFIYGLINFAILAAGLFFIGRKLIPKMFGGRRDQIEEALKSADAASENAKTRTRRGTGNLFSYTDMLSTANSVLVNFINHACSPLHLLLSASLTFLDADIFTNISDALALICIRKSERTDLSGGFAN